jgi:protoporphyrin/coproporphyrin ferrochelatase
MSNRAILLANLGSPDSPSVKDVKPYLKEFLMDERVIDVPYFFRTLLVKGIIVPFRSPKSAAKYKTIWTDEGSPLIVITHQLAEKVKQNTNLPVYVCMRYGNPTPQSALAQIQKELPSVEEVILLPLYPHYAMSSYETAVVSVQEAYKNGAFGFRLNVVPPYYKHHSYIKALAASIRPFLNTDYDQILFSYHGVPERHIRKTDPTGNHCLGSSNCCETESPAHSKCYRHQVRETTVALANELSIPEDKFSISFQSRLGTDKWLSPSTAGELKRLPGDGVKKLLVVCPAFVSDCLETLEEIHVEGKEIFMEAGGEWFQTIPCLNSTEEWVNAIGTLVSETFSQDL